MVTPAALELSLRAAEECQRQRAALDRQWRLRLERARQDAERVYRQYNAVEPENRLVARTLERQWEEALLAQRALEEEYHRFQQEQPVRLERGGAAPDRGLGAGSAGAVAIAADVGGGETAGGAAAVAAGGGLGRGVEPRGEGAIALERRHGDGASDHRAVRSWEQVADAGVVWQRVQGWHAAGWTSRRMAEELNAAGYRTPHGQPFTAESVRQLVARGGPREAGANTPSAGRKPRRSGEGAATA